MSKRGSLRASDADRDQIVERLHRAATEGRIVAEELEQRVSAALKARTYDELEATVSDLPSPRHRNSRRESGRRPALQWTMATVRANPFLLVFAIPVMAVTMALLLAVTMVWLVLMVVILAVGGRRTAPPWAYTRHRGRMYARHHSLRSPRRGAGSYWA